MSISDEHKQQDSFPLKKTKTPYLNRLKVGAVIS